MAFYAIGDIHGNYDEFRLLLDKIKFDPKNDIVWLVGDLVNRGPESLKVLRFVKEHQRSMHMVLGNHELHLLAAAFSEITEKKLEKGSKKILKAEDKDELLAWLRQQPLMRIHEDKVLVHAAIYTTWTIEQAKRYSEELEAIIQGPSCHKFFEHMYGNKPDFFSTELTGVEYLRMITNVFTRTRFVTKRNRLDFDYKGTIKDAPTKLFPWYKAADRQNLSHTIVFGHWSALGLYQGENVVCVDSGAVWGGPLTAMNLDTREIIQVNNLTKKPMFLS